jgi:CheY-like chemotaxis protein
MSSIFSGFMKPATIEVGTSTKRILVIDDEDNIREVVHACLHNLAGWEVFEAASGWEGLVKAKEEQPDAILLDWMMPEMSGLEFLEHLQKIRMNRAIPIVLLTAKSHLDLARLLKYGVVELIAKPFNPITLPRQIAAVLGWE